MTPQPDRNPASDPAADVGVAAGESVDDRLRARRLARMRLFATGLLALMAAVFVLCGLVPRRWPALGPALAYLRAFSEAGMVGACADWFAVTALFRRPFGLPIPHTGIIPRKKDQIGDALGGFIAENFLTETVLEAKLRQLEVARWGAAWLRAPDHADGLARRLTGVLREILRLVAPETRRDLTAAMVEDLARALPAAPLAASLVRAVWDQGRSQALLDRLLDLVSRVLATNEALIREQIAGRTFSWAPRWLDRKIADKIVKVLGEVVEDMRRPDHPWRAQVGQSVYRLLERLESDSALRERIDGLKRDILAHPVVLANLGQVWTAAEERLNPPTPEGQRALTDTATRLLISLGEWLERHDDAREILNAWARLAAGQVIAPRRHEIGGFIAEIVAGWDTRSIVEKLELQVGRDLQYIRINGTLVGGAVGLAIFTVSRWLAL
jgi:uncharacterized membrane-anchored protein YjiN (DUF445 family)